MATTAEIMANGVENKDHFDVAVIGAGMAGIVAAQDLSTRGHSVVLLKARDRVGRRTYMDQAFDGDISLETGGAYVHWTQPHMWHELERHGIGVEPPLAGDKIFWLAEGKVHSGTCYTIKEAVSITSPPNPSIPKHHSCILSARRRSDGIQ